MMMMMMMMGRTTLRCSHTFSMWALWKTPEAGRGWVIYAVYSPPIGPSVEAALIRCGDTSESPAIKRKATSRAGETRVVGGRSASFHLMVDAPLRVLARLEVSVQTPEVLTQCFLVFLKLWSQSMFLCFAINALTKWWKNNLVPAHHYALRTGLHDQWNGVCSWVLTD